jgi:hypothetical protein
MKPLMKRWIIFALISVVATAADKFHLPGQAGNDDLELAATLLLDHEAITQALGADPGDGYIVVRMKAVPKTEQPLRLSPDDFTLLSHKDGDRSQALSPGQIAGKGALVVKSSPDHLSSPGVRERAPLKVEARNTAEDLPLLSALKAKSFPDGETKSAVEGLLYFPIDNKVKPKDLSLIYKGFAGKLIIEFR